MNTTSRIHLHIGQSRCVPLEAVQKNGFLLELQTSIDILKLFIRICRNLSKKSTDFNRKQINLPMRSQRAAQLRVGSITEIILQQIQRKTKRTWTTANDKNLFGKQMDFRRLCDISSNPTSIPIKIRSCAINNTFVIFFHLKEWAVFTA